jgi:hypothetical protein
VLVSMRQTLKQATPGLNRLLMALQSHGDASAAPSRVVPDGPAWGAILCRELERLNAQLRDADMAATATMTDIQRRFGVACDPLPGEPLTSLDAAIQALDFERALALSMQWIEVLRGAARDEASGATLLLEGHGS